MRGKSPIAVISLLLPVLALCLAASAADGQNSSEIGALRVEKTHMKAKWVINADYPTFDIPDVDDHIKEWLHSLVSTLMEMAKDDASVDAPEMNYQATIDYKIICAPAGAVNALFRTFVEPNFAAHPSTCLDSFTVSAKGKILSFESLFDSPECALAICAVQAPKLIDAYYGGPEELENVQDWLARGTAPNLENYSCFTVEPEGLRVYFQQYQIGPYASGMPEILIPLTALAPAGPKAEVWPTE